MLVSNDVHGGGDEDTCVVMVLGGGEVEVTAQV